MFFWVAIEALIDGARGSGGRASDWAAATNGSEEGPTSTCFSSPSDCAYSPQMPSSEFDPQRGRAAAAKLKALGVSGVLITAAEQGYITQVVCKMPECLLPRGTRGSLLLRTRNGCANRLDADPRALSPPKERGWASGRRQHRSGTPSLQPGRLLEKHRKAVRKRSCKGHGGARGSNPAGGGRLAHGPARSYLPSARRR